MRSIRIGEHFDPNLFNALGSVDDAHRTIHEGDRLAPYLQAAASVFRAHGLESRLGLALLHKHDDCEGGDHVIETLGEFNGEAALLSRTLAQTPEEAHAVPVVWQLHGNTLQPLEYTADELAVGLYRAGEISTRFLAEFAALSDTFAVGRCFGLSIVRRGFYETANETQGAIEFSNLVERCNVTYLRDRAAYEGRAIQTTWTFATGRTRGCDRTCYEPGNGSHRPHHKPDGKA